MKLKRLLFCILFAFLLVGCTKAETQGGGNNGGDDPTGDVGDQGGNSGNTDPVEPPAPVITYTVTVYDEDGNKSTETVDQGDTFYEPTLTVDNEHMFCGWYFDKDLTKEATFPLAVNSDISLYPKVMTNKEYFLTARDKTVNSNYTYEDTLSITTNVPLISDTMRKGIIKQRTSDDFSYLACYTSSGALLSDGESYILHKGNLREEIKLKEDGTLDGFSTKSIEDSDSSTFAKAIFEYEADDIESLVYVSNNKYELKTTANASSVISSILGIFNNPVISSIISVLPEVSPSYDMYVTYDGDYIDTYTYEFEVSATLPIFGDVTLTVEYSLDFINYDTPALEEPKVPSLFISSAEIDEAGNTFKTDLEEYKSKEVSKYKYELDINVEDEESPYTANVQGEATRKHYNDNIYFNNHITTDTNFKTHPAYEKIEGIDGYEINRANIADGSVYSVTDTWGWNNDIKNSTSRGNVDNYYLLIDSDIFSSSYIVVGQKTDKGSYSFILNNEGILKLLKLFNEQFYLEEDSNEIKVLGIYDEDSVVVEEANIEVVYVEGILSEINITITGTIDTTYDKNQLNDAEFEIEYSMKIDSSIEDYDIPTKSKDIHLD